MGVAYVRARWYMLNLRVPLVWCWSQVRAVTAVKTFYMTKDVFKPFIESDDKFKTVRCGWRSDAVLTLPATQLGVRGGLALPY